MRNHNSSFLTKFDGRPFADMDKVAAAERRNRIKAMAFVDLRAIAATLVR